LLQFVRRAGNYIYGDVVTDADVELENLALHHQVGVAQRSAAKRPKLTSGDRLFWICLSRLWYDWRSTLAVVKPETVVAWHLRIFIAHGAEAKNSALEIRQPPSIGLEIGLV